LLDLAGAKKDPSTKPSSKKTGSFDISTNNEEDNDDISDLGGSRATWYPPTEFVVPDQHSVNTRMMEEGNFTMYAPSTIKSKMREVRAPRGKLGLIVDDDLHGDGPIISDIKPNSPLQNKVFPGDSIVAINGVDTRHMRVEQVTELLANSKDPHISLTVAR
jgi:hypothetical protein